MPAAIRRFKTLFAVASLGLVMTLGAVDMAEARRSGGGFGSRGTRTFDAPAATRTAPAPAAPIDRTMTPRTQTNQPNAAQPQAQPSVAQQRPGMFGGFGRSMFGGLLMGGLLGMMLGSGFGGGFGFLGLLLQVALIGGAIMLAMRFFARRNQPAAAGTAGFGTGASQRNAYTSPAQTGSSFKIPQIGSLAGSAGSAGAARAAAKPAPASVDELGITPADLDIFEKMLKDVQSAYSAEDYAKLRAMTTPEAMSYLAEEMGENATSGVKNDVTNVQLLQGDVAESWREEGGEYATVAMRYSSIDVMRDRNTGRLVSGDEKAETETVELWTFVRRNGSGWLLSAIQGSKD